MTLRAEKSSLKNCFNMKKLELGESKLFPGRTHEELLMEMCKVLMGDCYFNDDGTIGIVEGDFKAQDIPWLEICMLHLPKVLANPNNRAHDIAVRQAYHLHEFFHHPKHIVDYLYYEFQNKTIWTKR